MQLFEGFNDEELCKPFILIRPILFDIMQSNLFFPLRRHVVRQYRNTIDD